MPSPPDRSVGETYYVAPDGDDDWSGTTGSPHATGADGPFKTLARATESLAPGDQIVLRGGTYRECLDLEHRGTAERPLRITNYADEPVVLSGAELVTEWEPEGDGVFAAQVSVAEPDRLSVFLDGEQLTEARWPSNEGTRFRPTLATVEEGSTEAIVDPAIPDADWTGATIWCGGGSEWIYWASEVTTFDASTHELSVSASPDHGDYGGYINSEFAEHYVPRTGNNYVLMGVPAALDAPGEWCYTPSDATLRIIPPAGVDPRDVSVEISRRDHVIDVSGCANVHIEGIDTFAGGIVSGTSTKAVHFEGITSRHIGHSYRGTDLPTIDLRGSNNQIRDCDFGYSAGSVLTLAGADHEVINSHIHHGNYAARFGAGTLAISGTGHVVSHNTVSHAGRDLVTVFGMADTIVQHNDFSNAGWIASDLGMVYGHTNDFQNSVFRYNAVHDNQAADLQMGIYFDHLSQNLIIHNNAIWNVKDDPIRINNPSYFVLLYHNSAYQTGTVGTFDHTSRDDLYGCHVRNNIFNADIDLPDHVVVTSNVVTEDPGYVDPNTGDLSLSQNSMARDVGIPISGLTNGNCANLGAVQDETIWTVGHDFERSPTVNRDRPAIAYENQLQNGAFETGALEPWTATDSTQVAFVEGNMWGTSPVRRTGTGNWVLRLRAGPVTVSQSLTDLHPATTYVFSGWVNVETTFGVELTVGETTTTVDPEPDVWTRFELPFETETTGAAPTVSITNPNDGGTVDATNLGVQQQYEE